MPQANAISLIHLNDLNLIKYLVLMNYENQSSIQNKQDLLVMFQF